MLPLQLHNPWILGIEWPDFISSLLLLAAVLRMRSLLRAGRDAKLGTMLDTSAMRERMTTIDLPRPRDCGEFILFPFLESWRTGVEGRGITLTSVPRWGEWPQCYLQSTVCLPSQTQLQRGYLPATHRRTIKHEDNVSNYSTASPSWE